MLLSFGGRYSQISSWPLVSHLQPGQDVLSWWMGIMNLVPGHIGSTLSLVVDNHTGDYTNPLSRFSFKFECPTQLCHPPLGLIHGAVTMPYFLPAVYSSMQAISYKAYLHKLYSGKTCCVCYSQIHKIPAQTRLDAPVLSFFSQNPFGLPVHLLS